MRFVIISILCLWMKINLIISVCICACIWMSVTCSSDNFTKDDVKEPAKEWTIFDQQIDHNFCLLIKYWLPFFVVSFLVKKTLNAKWNVPSKNYEHQSPWET